MRDETQDCEIVTAELLPLISLQGLTQALLLLLHRCSSTFLEQILKAPLAEGTAARTADLIDETVGGEIEGIPSVEV
jgi:hypothetical protein